MSKEMSRFEVSVTVQEIGLYFLHSQDGVGTYDGEDVQLLSGVPGGARIVQVRKRYFKVDDGSVVAAVVAALDEEEKKGVE